MHLALTHVHSILLWGLIATVALTTIMQGSFGFGLSRLSLPLLAGTVCTGNRRWANILGVLIYVVVGWIFAYFYLVIFQGFGYANAWLGALVGLAHGLFVLVVLLPLLPQFHPRMASEYDAPSEGRRLEPPGFLGMNYGVQTPVVALIGHTTYGAILGAFLLVPSG